MLMEVKNQINVSILSIKYAIQKELLNKATFLFDSFFMILNNASFLIQWLVLFNLKNNIGGYDFKQIVLLWGIAAGTYGVAHFFFKEAFSLADTIHTGKLDAYLIQPKNVLLSAITSSVEVSAVGDMIYAIIMLFVYGFSIKNLLLVLFFSITGGIIMTCFAVLFASLSFWVGKADFLADTFNSLQTHFGTYPEGIFKGITKIFFYTIIPIGFTTYLPVYAIMDFKITTVLINVGVMILCIIISSFIFNLGLKRYSSSNLMNVRT